MIITSCHNALFSNVSAISLLVLLLCTFFFFFFVVQINYISLTFLAGPIFFTFWHLAIKLDCCRHHIVMVTTEPNDADGWNISIINDGKHFLKIHPLYKGRDECLVLLISPILLQAFVN